MCESRDNIGRKERHVMRSAIEKLREIGQSVWYDNVSRGMIESGELQSLIDIGVTGLTSNPTIFHKAIAESSDYDASLTALVRAGKSPAEVFEAIGIADIQSAADLLRPIFDDTHGADGYASFEVNPHLAHDTEGTVEEARRLFAALDRPNVMIKVPATPECIPAIQTLIGDGVNVNVTLTFSLHAYRQVRDAYIAGVEDLDRSGMDVGRVASVASFFVSRVDTAIDNLLDEFRADPGLQGRAAISNAKLAYRDFKADFESERFRALADKGARVQHPLWASTSTKNPAYSDLLYVESLVGPNTVNTMPRATINAVLDHASVSETIEEEVSGAEEFLRSLADVGIDMDGVTDRLLSDGVKAFSDSYDALIEDIHAKSNRLSIPTGR